ncbi:Cellulose 1,4-beta-cellobiosidase precursor [compost metagenome]
MVAGGPNVRLQDETAAALLAGAAPAACYVDHMESYSTNEMTIYWNSPAVFVAAYAGRI